MASTPMVEMGGNLSGEVQHVEVWLFTVPQEEGSPFQVLEGDEPCSRFPQGAEAFIQESEKAELVTWSGIFCNLQQRHGDWGGKGVQGGGHFW